MADSCASKAKLHQSVPEPYKATSQRTLDVFLRPVADVVTPEKDFSAPATPTSHVVKQLDMTKCRWLASPFASTLRSFRFHKFLTHDAWLHTWFSMENLKPQPIEFGNGNQSSASGLMNNVQCIEFDALGSLFMTCTHQGKARLFDYDDVRNAQAMVRNAMAKNSSLLLTDPPIVDPIHTFDLAPAVGMVRWIPNKDAEIACCSLKQNALHLYNLATLPRKPTTILEPRSLLGHSRGQPALTCVAFVNGVSNTLVTGDESSEVRLWDLRDSGSPRWQLHMANAARPILAKKSDTVSGVKRPRPATTSIVDVAPTTSHIMDSWTIGHYKVRDIIQGSNPHSLFVVMVGGVLVEIDMRKMQRVAFASHSTPTVVGAWATMTPHPLHGLGAIQGALQASRTSPEVALYNSDGTVDMFDLDTKEIFYRHVPTDAAVTSQRSLGESIVMHNQTQPHHACTVDVGGTTMFLVPQQRRITRITRAAADTSKHYRGSVAQRPAEITVLYEGVVLERIIPGKPAGKRCELTAGSLVQAVPTSSNELLVGNDNGEITIMSGASTSAS